MSVVSCSRKEQILPVEEPRAVKGLRKKPVIVEPSTPTASGAPPEIPSFVKPTEEEDELLRFYFASQSELQTKINAIGDLVKARHKIPSGCSLNFNHRTGELEIIQPRSPENATTK